MNVSTVTIILNYDNNSHFFRDQSAASAMFNCSDSCFTFPRRIWKLTFLIKQQYSKEWTLMKVLYLYTDVEYSLRSIFFNSFKYFCLSNAVNLSCRYNFYNFRISNQSKIKYNLFWRIVLKSIALKFSVNFSQLIYKNIVQKNMFVLT